MNENTIKTNGFFEKLLYTIFSIVAPVSGVITGVMSTLAVAANYMYDDATGDYFYSIWNVHIKSLDLNSYAVHILPEFMANASMSDFIGICVRAAVLGAAVYLISIIILAALSGKFKLTDSGEIELNWFDRIWSEVQLVLLILSGVGAVTTCLPIMEVFPSQQFAGFYEPYEVNTHIYGMDNGTTLILAVSAMFACILIFDLLFISMIKKIKARGLIRHSICGICFMGVGTGVKSVTHSIQISDRSMIKYIAIMVGMVFLAMTWFGAIIDLILIFIFVPQKVKKFREISRGVDEVRSGNLTYEIPVEMSGAEPKTDLDVLAMNINQISEASKIAIQNELKNQRLKTELISNVSHDLKTPLTSMISYIDLLKKEGLDSENAPEYLKIIDEKTNRLKSLTENLFEAAKASSGAIPCEITDIDLSALVNQSLAEMEGKLSIRGLETIIRNDCEKSVVRADGQLLWRVIENLLSNASKYAQESSRVYINLSQTVMPGVDKKPAILLEVKNISAQQLNISAEELMERFTRGDSSRNTEGSGLGLAIAKDLTNLMGGQFAITVDGDLFKASVILPEA